MGGYSEWKRGAWVAQSVGLPLWLRSCPQGLWFEPRIGLCADSSEPGTCFGFCVSLSLCPSSASALSLSQKINKHLKKKQLKKKKEWERVGCSPEEQGWGFSAGREVGKRLLPGSCTSSLLCVRKCQSSDICREEGSSHMETLRPERCSDVFHGQVGKWPKGGGDGHRDARGPHLCSATLSPGH